MVSLKKALTQEISFNQFLKDVYKFDYYNFMENFETYGFETEDERNEFEIDFFDKLDYYLSNKIIEDFNYLQKFFEEECIERSKEISDNYTFGTLEISIDIPNDKITFQGDYNILAIVLTEILRGYGLFYYDNLNDFYSSIPAVTENEKFQNCVDHLHWLTHFDEIYGATKSIFNKRSIEKEIEYLSY